MPARGNGYRTAVRNDDEAARIMVFAPAPELTVTVEDRSGVPDLHVHAGSQGVWQARMIASLGVRVSLVAAVGGEGIEAGSAVLSGPTDHGIVPAELYRRLAADLTANGCRVFADLSGELLDAALAGGLTFLKVSHEELLVPGLGGQW